MALSFSVRSEPRGCNIAHAHKSAWVISRPHDRSEGLLPLSSLHVDDNNNAETCCSSGPGGGLHCAGRPSEAQSSRDIQQHGI